MVVQVKALQSEKAQSSRQRELVSLIEHTAPTLPETSGLELSLYFNLCASLCNRGYINIYFYTFIIKNTLQSVSRQTADTAVALF